MIITIGLWRVCVASMRMNDNLGGFRVSARLRESVGLAYLRSRAFSGDGDMCLNEAGVV